MTRMSRRRSAMLIAGALVLTTSIVSTASPATPVARAAAPARFVTGWIPYWEMDATDDADSDGVVDGIDGLNAAPGVFADANVFDFEATGATTLTLQGGQAAFTKAVSTLRAKGLTTFGTVVDHMGKLGMYTVLADDTSRAAHVQAIVDLAVLNKLDGIDIDYENFAFTDGRTSWPTTQPVWVKFVNELGTALHAQSKLLAVTVPAIWEKGNRGYTVYDWANIIDAVDRLRIMVYDWSVPNAANAPMSWVNSVIDYAKTTVPNSMGKLQLGVPTYGYSWASIVSGECPANASLGKASVQTQSAPALAAKYNTTPAPDPTGSGEMLFTYTLTFEGVSNVSLTPPPFIPPVDIAPIVDEADPAGLKPATRVMQPGRLVKCTVKRTVVYPDNASVVQRAKAALQAGMAGIAIWALGYEDPTLWSELAKIDPTNSSGALGVATLGDVDDATAVEGGVEVRGWAFDPEIDLPVSIQVAVNGAEWSGSVLARDRRDDVARVFQGVQAEHGFQTVIPAAVQPGDTICVRAIGWGDQAAPQEIGCVIIAAPATAPETTTEPTTTTTTTGPTTTEPTTATLVIVGP